MAYQLLREENVMQAIRRVVIEEYTAAGNWLCEEQAGAGNGVHEARKCFKRIRGALRLVRKELGKYYGVENSDVRNLAQQLASVRDAQAMLETLAKLREQFGEYLQPDTFNGVATALQTRMDGLTASEGTMTEVIDSVRESIITAQQRVEAWPDSKDTFGTLQPGLERIYRNGLLEFRRAQKSGESFYYHEWRKNVKYLWYHVTLLENIWPKMMLVQKKALKSLSDVLGDEHDLTVFQAFLPEITGDFKEAAEIQLLLGLVERRQSQLREMSVFLGERIYAEEPEAFTRRLRAYWCAWTHENDTIADLI